MPHLKGLQLYNINKTGLTSMNYNLSQFRDASPTFILKLILSNIS